MYWTERHPWTLPQTGMMPNATVLLQSRWLTLLNSRTHKLLATDSLILTSDSQEIFYHVPFKAYSSFLEAFQGKN